MSTVAILPDISGFEWDGTRFPSESTFNNILSQFGQDPVFLDPLYQAPDYYLSPISPIPNEPLTHLLPTPPSSSELDKTGKRSSCITNNCIGDDGLYVKTGEGLQSKHPVEYLDSSCAEMNQAKIMPSPTAGLLERRHSTMSNEESLVGSEKSPAQVKMRSASSRPKKVSKKPALPAHVVQARECHNNIEKQYRTRLKQKFERLLAVLQASNTKDESGGEGESEAPDCGYSRGEVLDFARQRILTLEEDNRHLADQLRQRDRRFAMV